MKTTQNQKKISEIKHGIYDSAAAASNDDKY